eukprot:TRINITY_DN2589_c0_g1_i2.p1 TRINITY_DN2589_c0_g1~~TRINITY_DN2589_c0_g1_i2.p1  ORF type:complete len:189 (+),score=4.92 TRINITY_DN2589_c0_g1_i2:245-811(+)
MARLGFVVLCVVVGLVSVCLGQYSCSKPCYGNMCCSVPSNGLYYLTTFCDQSTACGPSCDSAPKYFAADSQRFGCGTNLTICTESGHNCVYAVTIDAGPNISVERDAGRAIIDASSACCQTLFRMGQCGWSGHRAIRAYVSDDTLDFLPHNYGPIQLTDEQLEQVQDRHNVLLQKIVAKQNLLTTVEV